MHAGRIALLERLKEAEENLFAAIEAAECVGPDKYSYVLDKEVGMIADAMAGVYRRAMHIDGDYLQSP